MFSKSNLLATLVTGIFFFLGGHLIWGILMADFFAEHAGTATGVMNENPDMLHLALACLLQAFFLSAIYGKWARGIHSMKEGFQFGALVGAFTGFGLGLLWFATGNLSDFTGMLVNGVIEVIFYGIAGALIGVMFKATSK